MVHGSCHMGIVKLKQKLHQNVYWLMTDRDAELFVKDCEPCSDSDKTHRTQIAPLKPRNIKKDYG